MGWLISTTIPSGLTIFTPGINGPGGTTPALNSVPDVSPYGVLRAPQSASQSDARCSVHPVPALQSDVPAYISLAKVSPLANSRGGRRSTAELSRRG